MAPIRPIARIECGLLRRMIREMRHWRTILHAVSGFVHDSGIDLSFLGRKSVPGILIRQPLKRFRPRDH
jgi:hypothetical protein